jgi:hypothetical protein
VALVRGALVVVARDPVAPRPAGARPRSRRALAGASDEVVVVDPEALEVGVTELLPIVRQMRWTPEIGPIPGLLAPRPAAAQASSHAAADDEVILPGKRRRPLS